MTGPGRDPQPGRLVLVATPLGNLGDLSPRAASVLGSADTVACEDTRHTARLLNLAGIARRRLVAVHGHNEAAMVASIVGRLRAGETVAVVSDAGTPGVSDPGERLVRAAAAAGFAVSVVPGPSAAIAALVVSGLPTDRFVFEGFLPRKGPERAARLGALAVEARTAVLYEAPHRLAATLADLTAACGPERPVVLVRELTKMHEEIWRGGLGASVSSAMAGAPRGEFVVVLGGAAEPAPVDDDTLAEALAEQLAAGLGRRDAAAAVAARLGVARNRAYDVAVRLPGNGHVPPVDGR